MNTAPKEKSKKEEILEKLNDQQKTAAINYNGACAIIAAPGSGKTATLIARAAYMIEECIDPRNILLFTFTRKAANEIKERVINRIGDAGKNITVGTYHSFCVRILHNYADAIGFKRNFSIYDEDEKISILKDITKLEKKELLAIMSKISHFKMNLVSPTMAKQVAKTSEQTSTAEYYEKYQQKMKSLSAFDFDDLIYYTIRLLENNPDIKNKINRRYKYITCDEAHDSSPEDLRLIELLGGDKFNVCIILDPDQSIYGFRGANMPAVFEFMDKFKFKHYLLECNYRSTSTIVEAAKTVIKNNPTPIEKNAFAFHGAGLPVLQYKLSSAQKEAYQVVKIINSLKKKNGYTNKDFAILYRTQSLSRVIEEVLLKNRIPYKISGGNPFYDRKEIKDLMCYIRLINNPNDIEAFRRVVNIPKRNIGEKTLDKLLTEFFENDNIEDTKTILEFCKETKCITGRSLEGLKSFNNEMSDIINFSETHDCKELIKFMYTRINYGHYLVTYDEEGYDDRIDNIGEMMSIAEGYTDLHEFIYSMTLNSDLTDELQNGEELDGINMMTMHASKGLEFPVVIVIGASEGIAPHWKSIQENNIEEERRLFFVAMTRAEKILCIIHADRRMMFGRPVMFESSRFMKEISNKYSRTM